MEHGIIAGAGRSASARGRILTLAAALALLVSPAFAAPGGGSKATKPICGNNVAEGPEACDGSDLRSGTCQSLGFAGGSLSCAANCTYQTGSCLSLLRYQDNHDGTVTDLSSGLQWEQKNAGDNVPDLTNPHDGDNVYTWGNFSGCPIVGCPNGTGFTDFLGRLNYNMSDKTTTYWPCFAGHCDWRLPTVDELVTIMDFNSPTCGNGGACIDPIFGPSKLIVASSTTAIDELPLGSYAWAVYSATGTKQPIPKTSIFQFRAVRSAH